MTKEKGTEKDLTQHLPNIKHLTFVTAAFIEYLTVDSTCVLCMQIISKVLPSYFFIVSLIDL